MLRFLSIARLAIIDAVELEFGPGLNVLTGETGAGKSIVVGAVELLLGGRASARLVRSGEEKATSPGRPRDVRSVARRSCGARSPPAAAAERSSTARSSPAQELRDVTAPLVDLHGQHDHQALLDPQTHVAMLDGMAGLDAPGGAGGRGLRALEGDQAPRSPPWTSTSANGRPASSLWISSCPRWTGWRRSAGEDEELGRPRQLLLNADRLQRLCAEAYADLYDGDGAVLDRLARVVAAGRGTGGPRPGVRRPRGDPRECRGPDQGSRLPRCASERLTWTRLPSGCRQLEDRLAAIERLKRRYGPALSRTSSSDMRRSRAERDLAVRQHRRRWPR